MKLNKKQVLKLKFLISQHMKLILVNKKKAANVFRKIKKYGVSNMPEAIDLYKKNKKVLN